MTRGRVYEGITMTDKMTVAIAAGGTAGHINPALALAEELRDRGHHVVFVGQSRKLEGRLVPEAGFDFVPITVTGFDRSRPWTALTSLWRVNKAKRALASHFSKVGKPDAAIGFGAYVEVPLLGWCKGAGVPYLLHEQNSVPGLANKMMNSHAARVCISVPAARAVFERDFEPVSAEAVARAREVLLACREVVCCVRAFGTGNARNAELLDAARETGIPVRHESPHRK